MPTTYTSFLCSQHDANGETTSELCKRELDRNRERRDADRQ